MLVNEPLCHKCPLTRSFGPLLNCMQTQVNKVLIEEQTVAAVGLEDSALDWPAKVRRSPSRLNELFIFFCSWILALTLAEGSLYTAKAICSFH